MAYKFQLGKFVASGSIEVEDRFDVQGDAMLSGSIFLGDAQSDEIKIKAGDLKFLETHVFEMKDSEVEAIEYKDASNAQYMQLSTAGTGSIIMHKRLDAGAGIAISGSIIKAEADELNQLDGASSANSIASKAVIMNGSRQVGGIVALSASTGVQAGSLQADQVGHHQDPDIMTLDQQKVDFANDVDVDIQKAGGLQLAGVPVTANAGELNVLDGFQDAGLVPGSDSIVFLDATDQKFKSESAADFASSISAGALTASAGVLGVKVDDASLEMDTDHLQVKALGVTNAMLAGSIANAKLANSAVTLSQGPGMAAMGAVSLGGTVEVGVDGVLQDLDTLGEAAQDGEFIVATGAGTFAYESGATVRTSLGLGTGDSPQFTGLTLSGDLVVQGTTTTVNVEVVNTANGVIFEGATADAHELTLSAVDPTADRAVQIADSAGTLVPFAATPAAGVTISATPAELNLLDATAGSSLALQGGDALIIGDSSDSNATKKVLVSDMATFVGNNIAESVQSLSANTNLVISNGAQVLLNATGGAFTVTLPQNNADTEGKILKFKKISTGQNAVTIHRQGTDTIDGGHSIVLESDFAAVSLISDGNGKWYVM